MVSIQSLPSVEDVTEKITPTRLVLVQGNRIINLDNATEAIYTPSAQQVQVRFKNFPDVILTGDEAIKFWRASMANAREEGNVTETV